MTGQELLEMLISWIENKGYIVKNVNLDGGIANISSLYKLCAIDFSVATAFWICHEFVHAKYEDKRVCENDSMSPSEKRANKEAFGFYGIFLKNMVDAKMTYHSFVR